MFRVGERVADPVFWKKIQNILIVVGTTVPAVVIHKPELALVVDLDLVAACGVICGAIAAILTITTTRTMGI